MPTRGIQESPWPEVRLHVGWYDLSGETRRNRAAPVSSGERTCGYLQVSKLTDPRCPLPSSRWVPSGSWGRGLFIRGGRSRFYVGSNSKYYADPAHHGNGSDGDPEFALETYILGISHKIPDKMLSRLKDNIAGEQYYNEEKNLRTPDEFRISPDARLPDGQQHDVILHSLTCDMLIPLFPA